MTNRPSLIRRIIQFVGVACLLTPSLALADFQYTVVAVDLGTLGGGGANGVNNFGQVVGGFTAVGPAGHAYLSAPNGGTIKDLGTLGGNRGTGRALNSVNQVTGDSNLVGNAAAHAFLSAPNGGCDIT